MKLKSFIFSALLVFSLAAEADGPVAVELYLSDIRLPVSESGKITFRSCSNCDYQQALASNDVRYILNNEATTFQELRDGVAGARDPGRSFVTLIYDEEIDRITMVKVLVR